MARITDAFLVKHHQDRTRPAGVTAAQPQTFLAVSFPTLLELHLVCHVRGKRTEFGQTRPLTLDVTDANGYAVQAQIRAGVMLDAAKRMSPEGVESQTLRCPSLRLILHEPGTYRLILHLPDSPSFAVPFTMLGSDIKLPYEAAHDLTTVPISR